MLQQLPLPEAWMRDGRTMRLPTSLLGERAAVLAAALLASALASFLLEERPSNKAETE